MIELNFTLIIQLIVVLILMVVLNQMAFRPFLQLIQGRRKWMSNMEKKTRELQQRAAEMMEKYQEAITAAQTQGAAIREEIRRESLRREMEILQQAREDANLLLKEMKDKINHEIAAAKVELQEHAQKLAREIVAKILGRSLA